MFEITFWQAFLIAMLLTHYDYYSDSVFAFTNTSSVRFASSFESLFQVLQWLTTGMVTKSGWLFIASTMHTWKQKRPTQSPGLWYQSHFMVRRFSICESQQPQDL